MGRKVHPIGFRLKINKTWTSRWFADPSKYAGQLHEDRAIRSLVARMMPQAGISGVDIERFPNNVHVTVNTAKPGIVIGRKGARGGDVGIKVMCPGRLSGIEMARREWMREGRVPAQTLRADIDFAKSEALTTYGRIGVKVWIYRGDVQPEALEQPEATDVYVSE